MSARLHIAVEFGVITKEQCGLDGAEERHDLLLSVGRTYELTLTERKRGTSSRSRASPPRAPSHGRGGGCSGGGSHRGGGGGGSGARLVRVVLGLG